MRDYIKSIGVHQIKSLDPPGKWRNVTDNRGTNFPVFSHDDELLAIIVGVNVADDETFTVAHHLGGNTTFSDPLFTATTDTECAEKLNDYMSENP